MELHNYQHGYRKFQYPGQIAMREDWPKDMWRTSGRISMYFIEERMVELGKPEEGPAEGLEALEQWSQQAFPAMVRVIEETKIAMRDAITAEVRAMLGAIREVHPFAIYLIEGEDERTIERVELAGVASES